MDHFCSFFQLLDLSAAGSHQFLISEIKYIKIMTIPAPSIFSYSPYSGIAQGFVAAIVIFPADSFRKQFPRTSSVEAEEQCDVTADLILERSALFDI